MRPRNSVLLLLVVLLWGANWTAMKIGLSYVGPIPFALHRFLISGIALFPILLFLRKGFPTDRVTCGRLIVYSLIYMCLTLSQQIGLTGTNSSTGAMLTYTQPIFVYCLGIPLLREKVRPVNFLGVSVSFLGVFFLVARGMNVSIYSSLVLILGGFLWAVTIVFYKRYLVHVDPFVTTSFQLSFCILPLLILCLVSHSFSLPNEAAYTVVILYSSLGSLAAGTMLWLFLLRHEDATVVSGLSLMVPMVATLFGWQLLGEAIYIESLLGSALILVGTYLVTLGRHSETAHTSKFVATISSQE